MNKDLNKKDLIFNKRSHKFFHKKVMKESIFKF